MRVMHVSAYFAPAFGYGGPPQCILGLCKGLKRAGVDVEVFTTTANGAKTDLPPSPAEGNVYEGVCVRYFARSFPRRFFGTSALAAALTAEVQRFDLVHIHGLWNLPAWYAASRARRAGLPYVLSPHGMLEPRCLAHHAWRKRIAYPLFERRNLTSAAFLHATSTTEARTIEGFRFGVEVIDLPNGVDPWEGSPPVRGDFRSTLGLPPDAPLIVFLGRIHPLKRLDLLADAFQRIRGNHPRAQLVIAGPSEGDCRRALETRFAHARAAVHWTGELEQADKWSLLSDADALLMCSDSESFGLSVAEALSAGVPVVVTRTCPWEEIEKAGCGFWVEQDVGAIAAALCRLLADPARARAMGECGKAWVQGRFSWESIAQAMADRYAVALNGRSRPGIVNNRG